MNTIIFDHQSKNSARQNMRSQVQNVGVVEHLSDEKLLRLCQQYGKQAREWRQKFIGLLPEVNRRRLYEKKGFSSIFEFAAKLAGISEEQVRLVLNLERKFEDKPVLQSLLLNGEVSANKLVRVASIATIENQKTLAEQVKVLPQKALETWVRDEKMMSADRVNFDVQTKSLCGSLRAHSKPSQLFDDVKLLQKFSEELKEKLQELDQKGIDINQLLLNLLEKREEEIETQKEEIAETLPSATSRYIPVRIKKILKEEFGEKCSISLCRKPAETIHHTQRFSLSQNHDPRFLALLCSEHHVIAHSVDLKYHRVRERVVG